MMRKLNLIPKMALALVFVFGFVSKIPNTQITDDKTLISHYSYNSNIVNFDVVDVGMAD